jgi:hypothetical protein
VSGSVRPDRAAFAELDRLVRSLGEELSFFRRRALEAERRLRELVPESTPAGGAPGAAPGLGDLRTRVTELERENQDLRARLDEAAAKTKQMAERVRFLRQQQEAGGER